MTRRAVGEHFLSMDDTSLEESHGSEGLRNSCVKYKQEVLGQDKNLFIVGFHVRDRCRKWRGGRLGQVPSQWLWQL